MIVTAQTTRISASVMLAKKSLFGLLNIFRRREDEFTRSYDQYMELLNIKDKHKQSQRFKRDREMVPPSAQPIIPEDKTEDSHEDIPEEQPQQEPEMVKHDDELVYEDGDEEDYQPDDDMVSNVLGNLPSSLYSDHAESTLQHSFVSQGDMAEAQNEQLITIELDVALDPEDENDDNVDIINLTILRPLSILPNTLFAPPMHTRSITPVNTNKVDPYTPQKVDRLAPPINTRTRTPVSEFTTPALVTPESEHSDWITSDHESQKTKTPALDISSSSPPPVTTKKQNKNLRLFDAIYNRPITAPKNNWLNSTGLELAAEVTGETLQPAKTTKRKKPVELVPVKSAEEPAQNRASRADKKVMMQLASLKEISRKKQTATRAPFTRLHTPPKRKKNLKTALFLDSYHMDIPSRGDLPESYQVDSLGRSEGDKLLMCYENFMKLLQQHCR